MCLCQGDLEIWLLSLGEHCWAWGGLSWSSRTALCLGAAGDATVCPCGYQPAQSCADVIGDGGDPLSPNGAAADCSTVPF